MRTYEILDIEKCLEAIKVLNVVSLLTPKELESKLPLLNEAALSLSVLHVPDTSACSSMPQEIEEFRPECIAALRKSADKWLPVIDAKLQQLVNAKVK